MYSAHSHIESLYKKSSLHARTLSIMKGVDFCSNDYLSLKSHPYIKAHLEQFFKKDNSWCATGSRMVSGNSEALMCLEESFAQFVRRPSALFFANGYQANLALIASLAARCIVFSDEGNHASLIDGIKLAQCEKTIYRHNDMNHLEQMLKQPSKKPRAIITESIFSTNGTIADLLALDQLAKKYEALLLVDESHATGIFGQAGAGLLSNLDLCLDNIISTHSCGKALASFGAFIAGSKKVAAIIKNQSRQFICTTAPPPYLVAHISAVLELIHAEPWRRDALKANIAQAKGVLATCVPIITVPIKDDERALLIKNHLAQIGLDVAVFRYPSVKKDHAQLRITLHSANTAAEIDRLATRLASLL